MSTYNQLAGRRAQRIEALSDGVFAIAMTILVFDLKDPVTKSVCDADLLKSLSGLLPKLLTYFLSFLTLGIFWTGHSTQFNYIEKSDRNLNWTAIFFLMFVSLVPFTTNILSDHITNKISIVIYWLNIFAMGAMLYIHWHFTYAVNHTHFPEQEINTIDKAVKRRIIIAQLLYAGGALLCFVNNYLSIAVIILIQLNYAFAFFSKRSKETN